MKIKIMGTAAYERVPSLFCNCPACKLARKRGGKYYRSQTQTLIDDKLLIDFNMDNYLHTIKHNINFSAIENLLITHSHIDHFSIEEFTMRGGAFSHNLDCEKINIYGANDCYLSFSKSKEAKNCDFVVVKEFQTFSVGKYTITAIPASHNTDNPLCYVINDGEKTILYSLDTNLFEEKTYEFLAKNKFQFDLVLADCCYGVLDTENCGGHMSLALNEKHREKLKKAGCIKDSTKWLLTHFSHNGLVKNGKGLTLLEFKRIAKAKNMFITYDGEEIVL